MKSCDVRDTNLLLENQKGYVTETGSITQKPSKQNYAGSIRVTRVYSSIDGV